MPTFVILTLVISLPSAGAVCTVPLKTNQSMTKHILTRFMRQFQQRGVPNGNSIVPIDPITGAIGTPIFVGSERDKQPHDPYTTRVAGCQATMGQAEANNQQATAKDDPGTGCYESQHSAIRRSDQASSSENSKYDLKKNEN